MNPELATYLQAGANQFNVTLAVVETPEVPASDSQTFSPQAPVVPTPPAPVAGLPAPSTDQPTA